MVEVMNPEKQQVSADRTEFLQKYGSGADQCLKKRKTTCIS